MCFNLWLWMAVAAFVPPLADGNQADEPSIKHLHWCDGKPGSVTIDLGDFKMHDMEVTMSTGILKFLVSCFFNKTIGCHDCEATVAWIRIDTSCDALIITVPIVNVTQFDNGTIVAQGVNPSNISWTFRITVKKAAEEENNSPDGPPMMEACNGTKQTDFDHETKTPGLSTIGIVCIVIGIVATAVLLVIAFFIYRFCRRRQKPSGAEEHTMTDTNGAVSLLNGTAH